jgi:RNA-directed DNA polymerase
MTRVVSELRSYLLGWRNYFGFCQTPSVLRDFDSWPRSRFSGRRLRCYAWKQWKTGKRRFAELRRMGVGKDLAAQTAGSSKRYWHISRSPALNVALSRAYLTDLGLPLLLEPETKV